MQPDPHFRACDIKNLNYPVDGRIVQYPIFHSLLDRLKPIKAHYENALQYDMRR